MVRRTPTRFHGRGWTGGPRAPTYVDDIPGAAFSARIL